MLCEKHEEIRSLAIEKIQNSRAKISQYYIDLEIYPAPRNFELPRYINFEASTYTHLIDWDTEIISEPPMIQDMTNEEILLLHKSPFMIKNYPCHSQNVEAAIQIVMKASEARKGYENRHKYILNSMKSRKQLPSFEFKQNWKKC